MLVHVLNTQLNVQLENWVFKYNTKHDLDINIYKHFDIMNTTLTTNWYYFFPENTMKITLRFLYRLNIGILICIRQSLMQLTTCIQLTQI